MRETRAEWHQWFAWHPVIIATAENPSNRVWFQFVERRWKTGTLTGEGKWRYRPANPLQTGDGRQHRIRDNPAYTMNAPTERMIGFSATMVDGLAAKARVARWHYSKLWDMPPEENELRHQAIRSLIEAVEAATERAAHVGKGRAEPA